jgi:acetolactate synthase-1/2/3 large subunit
MSLTGAAQLIKLLAGRGIKQIFGYGGGAILPVMDAIKQQNTIKFTMSRTESGAGFMASGYANAGKCVGTLMTTSGPGALNALTPLHDAKSDGIPVLALTGQVATNVLGTDAFQEADVVGASKTCTKWNTMVVDGSNIIETVDDAFLNMLDKRPGPILLDLPKNVMSKHHNNKPLNRQFPFSDEYNDSTILASLIPTFIESSNRPVILAGHGVLQSNSVRELRTLAETYQIPVVTTLLGLGAMNEKSPLALRMMGMHGSYSANMAVQNCDLLLNFGSRFDDRIIGDPTKFAKQALIIHVDIYRQNINKVIKANHYIVGDCKSVLTKALKNVSSVPEIRKPWNYKVSSWKQKHPSWNENFGGHKILQGREVLMKLNKFLWSDIYKHINYTIVADVGAHQMWAAQYIEYDYPRIKFMTSGGLGSMGYAVPASIGAALAIGTKKEQIICICGDGGFTMSFVEILTAIENKVNVKIIIINNNYQLMVKMWQDKFYEGRQMGVKMNNPPFEEICKAMGCKAFLIKDRADLEKGLHKVLTHEKGPIVVNVITDDSEPVLPMVSPGKALDDMILVDSNGQIKGDAPC